MANDIYTFYPSFKEFLPIYRDVSRVWIGNGVTTGTSGMLYAEYADGNVAELGSVSLYATAVEMGYQGTERSWVQMIMGVSQLVEGTEVTMSYQVSENGQTPPSSGTWYNSLDREEFSKDRIKGKFIWTKISIKWAAVDPTVVYMASYQGQDGQVQSVNGQTNEVLLYGDNIPIAEDDEQSIKEYIDDNLVLDIATNEDIDALFSMTFFSGAAFITGRNFNATDTISYKIEALTQNAPMPEENIVTIHPYEGNSYHFSFGHVKFKLTDIPEGETQYTYQYKISDISHTMQGVPAGSTSYVCSVTLINRGEGLLLIKKSSNFNSLFFSYEYGAAGSITFEGTMTMDGRTMYAREFMIEMTEEGTENVWRNISTMETVAHNVPADIAYPTLQYTLDDVGVHTYIIHETSLSGDGVTIDDTAHTIVVTVRDTSPDGDLEIITDGSDKHVDFVNTYAATGSVIFYGEETLVDRLFRDTDTLSIAISGTGKLPSPATVSADFTVGDDSVEFEFPVVQYTLSNMSNGVGGYDDVKVFNYNITEVPNIPGTADDGLAHTVTVTVTDDKHGHLIVEPVYSDGDDGASFTRTYSAFGTLIIAGEKNLTNRKFVASDSMYVILGATNNGRLPADASKSITLPVGQNKASFTFAEIIYNFADLKGNASYTYDYFIYEDTIITGATNDSDAHTLSVRIADNYDGTLSVTPTYTNGLVQFNKFVFESIYDATGYIALIGNKTIVNRTFVAGDTMSVTIAAGNDGKLPTPTTISVPLTTGGATASFSFAQITYKITDLDGLATKTFNYTVTETTTMAGTAPQSTTDTVSVTVTDMSDGTLSVTPVYTNGTSLSFYNVYSATASLSFKARCVFTNGNMNANTFTVRITQVTGNSSTTQAIENVVLAAPVTMSTTEGSIQDLNFTNIVQFVKNSIKDDTQNTYWFMIEEVLPNVDANNIYNNVKYDATKKWINVEVTDNLNGTLTVTKRPSSEIDMTFTNEQLADLTIGKIWAGDHDRLTTAEKNAFTILVTGPDSYSESFTYADMTNDAMVLPNLALGEYTIAETNNVVENFSITTSYAVGASPTNRITLIRGGSRLNITDNVNKLEGTINIVATWSGEDNLLTAAQKNNVTFTLTGPKQKTSDPSTYSRTFTYADMVNNRMTIERLTLGTYTITESSYQFTDFDATVTYQISNIATNSVTIADADNVTFTVNTDYYYHKGSVKVTKQFDTVSALPVTYYITNDYNNTEFNVSNADNAGVADGIIIPYEWTIANVPVHTTIQFTEHNTSIANYDLVASAVPVDYTSSAVVSTETSVVAMTNHYIRHIGTAKVTALFVGITSAQKPNSFSITNDYNNSIFTFANADNTATADGVSTAYEWTITGVPTLETVHFTIHNTSITDYDVVSAANPASYTTAAIQKNTTSTVAITNTYTVHTGNVKVTAQFAGISNIPNSFQIENSYDQYGVVFTPYNADNASTADGITTPFEWTLSNVPVNTNVTFSESNVAVTNYSLSQDTVIQKSSGQVVKDTTLTVNFVNTYIRDTGTVEVTMSFQGAPSVPAGCYIENNYNASVFTYANADNAGTADGFTVPYRWTISNVPTTTQITFTEYDYNVTNYTRDSSNPTILISAAVTKNQTANVGFINSYTQDTGYVHVYASFGNFTPPQNFQITNNYNNEVFTLANGEDTGTGLGYLWTIQNVPVNTVIQFTETNYDIAGYTCSSTHVRDCAAVTKNTQSNVYFTHTYNAIATLANRTFIFNNNISGGNTSIEVDVTFHDDNNDTYTGLKYNAPENDHVLQYYPQGGYNWTDAYHWDDIGTNIWTNNDMKTITFTAEPTSFTGVANANEFETWLLSVATEEI